MLYAFLKLLCRLALRVYYRKVTISGREHLPASGPLVVVANHPNTFMDAIIIGTALRQPVYFLAKSTVFGSGLQSWFFQTMLHMIPVYRQQDLPSGAKTGNQQAFEKCFNFLDNKGTLLIFPEGSSFMEKRLREIKTGTARIALGAEARQGFGLGVQIVSIGLNYEAGDRFRSRVTVKIDSPLAVAAWKENWQQDQQKAAKALTEEIRKRLEGHLVLTRNEQEEKLLQQVKLAFGQELVKGLTLPPQEKDFLLDKGIAEAIGFFGNYYPDRLLALQTDLNAWFDDLEALKLKNFFLTDKKRSPVPGNSLWATLYTVAGFPLFVYGLLHNWPPYRLPGKLAEVASRHIEYFAPVAMLSGIFTFSLWYGVALALFQHWLGSGWLTLAYALTLPASGFFALHFSRFLQTAMGRWRLLSLFKQEKQLVKELLQRRQHMANTLLQARQEYLQQP